MKFKYFLRGLGTGIIFTSIICMVAFQSSGSKNISEKEIIERAKELGMIEKQESVEDIFAEAKQSQPEETKNNDSTQENSGKQDSENVTEEKKVTEHKTAQQQSSKGSKEEKSSELATTENTTAEKESNDTKKVVTITIKGGSSSYPVCQELQRLGLIADASDFDDYLVKNGYANRISVGTHTLKIGMTYEEIAIAISDPK